MHTDPQAAEHDEAPQYNFGDELSLSGRPHMIVGQDEDGRYVVAPTDMMLAVRIDGSTITATQFYPVRPGEQEVSRG